MDITKETIKINKIICEKKEQIVVQGDMIVPDSKPDILNTINTDGNICIYKKEGKIYKFVFEPSDTLVSRIKSSSQH